MASTDKDDIAAILKKNGCTYDDAGNLTIEPGADKCHELVFYKDMLIQNVRKDVKDVKDFAESILAPTPKANPGSKAPDPKTPGGH